LACGRKFVFQERCQLNTMSHRKQRTVACREVEQSQQCSHNSMNWSLEPDKNCLCSRGVYPPPLGAVRSPSLISSFTFLLSFLPLFLSFPSLSLEVGPYNPARGYGERCKLPQRDLGRSPSRNRIWCIVSLISVRYDRFTCAQKLTRWPA